MRYFTILSGLFLFLIAGLDLQGQNVNTELRLTRVWSRQFGGDQSFPPDPEWKSTATFSNGIIKSGSLCKWFDNYSFIGNPGCGGVAVYPSIFPNLCYPREGYYNDLIMNYTGAASGFSLADGFKVTVDLDAWEEDGDSPECIPHGNDDDRSSGQKIFWMKVPNTATFPYSYDFSIKTANESFEVNYRVIITSIDAISNIKLRYANTAGATQSSFCGGSTVRLYADRHAGYSGGYFEWQKLVGGNWVSATTSQYSTNNYLEVTASTPMPQIRVRVAANGGSGTATSDGWIDNIGQPITVAPAPPALADILTTITGTCAGNSVGAIQVTVNNTNPSSAYSLTLLNSSNVVVANANPPMGSTLSHTFTGLAAGVYSLKVTGASSSVDCTTQKSNITVPTLPLPVINTAGVAGNCFGNNGSVTVTISQNAAGSNTFDILNAAGTGSPLYTFTTSGTSHTFSVPAGTYQARVRNGNTCTSLLSGQVVVPAAPSSVNAIVQTPNAGGSGFQIACTGGSGTINITPSGGTPPYTIAVSGGASQTGVPTGSTRTFSRMAGTYTITVTDSKSCVFDGAATLTEPPVLLSVSATNLQDATDCAAVGQATLVGSGGASPYQYSLSSTGPFGASNVFINLSAGQHTAYIRDATGCQSSSPFTISAPSPLIVEPTTVVNASCFGSSNGSVTLGATGGNGAYEYRIGNGAFSSQHTFSGLAAATYTFQVRDASLCTDDVTVNVAGPDAIQLTGYSLGLTDCDGATRPFTVSFTGRANGILNFFDNGLEISIDNGANYNAFAENYDDGASVQVYFYEPVGNYQVRIRDAAGCVSNTLNVTAPAEPMLFANITSVTPETCVDANDGTITVSFGGGQGSYYIRLLRLFDSDGIGEIATFGPVSLAGSHTFTGLPPTNDGFYGGYLVEVIDAYDPNTFSSHCNIRVPQVNFPAPPGSGISIGDASAFNVGTAQSTGPLLNCYGNNGVITISGTSGGEPPYSYSINGFDFQSGNVFTGVGAQTQVYVRDNRGCTVGPQTVNIASAPVTLNTTATLLQPETSCTPGSIQVSITGGTAPYEYTLTTLGCDGTYPLLSNSTGAFSVSDLSAGNYTFCVRDAGGCTDQATVAVPYIAPPAITVTNVQNTTCFNGGNNGAVTLQAFGGTPPYTVHINNASPQTGNGAFTFSSLSAGSYLFTLTDAKGCSDFLVQSVSSSNIVHADIGSTNISGCSGGQTGTLEVIPSNGVAPYTVTWLWDNTSVSGVGEGQTASRNNLPAGVYEVRVTDAQGCQATGIEAIEEPQGVFATIQVTNALCSNVQDGLALINAVGGTPPYEYSLNAGPYQPDNFFENLGPGNYSVIVRDANSCFNTFNFTVGLQRVLSATATPTAAACFGQNSGSIAIGVTGGGTPYSFSVNNGPFNTANPITGLAAGTYNVLIQDNGGCEFALSNIVVTAPPQLTAAVNVLQNATCSLNTGTLQAVGSGGTPPYTYQWNGSSSLTNQILNNAPPGLNTVIITDSKGCTATAAATVANVPPLSLNPAGTTNELCDQANGTATVAPQGGTAPITYTWSHNAALNSPTATGLAAGTYGVTATDANGCSASLSVTVAETQGPSVSLAVTNSFCTNGQGSITAMVSGGLAPYTYSWSHNPGLNNPTAGNLTAGNYSVTVTDANGCSASASGTVQLVPPPVGVATVNAASCQGNNGSIQVAVTGGTTPYTFHWSHNPALTTAIATGLTAGTYGYTITDGGNCTFSGTATVGELPPPQVTINAQTATCGLGNGMATATVSGGTAPYTYMWSTGSPNNPQASSLLPGQHTLTVTDAFGCQDVETFTIQNIPGPSALNLAVQNSICSDFNGSITATPVGGTPPYHYTWSHNALLDSPVAAPLPAGNYSVTATDARGCTVVASTTVLLQPPPFIQTVSVQNSICTNGNGSIQIEAQGTPPYTYQWTNQVSTGPLAQNLSVGTYTVSVTDGSGCTSQQSFSIALSPGASLQVLNAVNDRCGQGIGSIRVRATGGATPYTFSWSHNPALHSDFATGLTAGAYTVSVTDGNGCTTTLVRTLTNLPGVTLGAATVTAAFCGNPVGQITVHASGGVGPYVYTWSHNAGLNSSTASGLAAGEYGVTVTDASNCTAHQSVVVENTPVPTLTLATVTETPCLATDGSITVTASGGIGAYTYTWSHNAALNNPTAWGLGSGTYTVTATDVNGCSATLTQAINDRQPPQLQLGTVTGSTCGSADGSISVSGSGGALPYTFSWSHDAGLNSATATGLAAGAYSVTLTDANACMVVAHANVSDTEAPELDIQYSDAACVDNSGSISVTVTGGTQPFDYEWSHDANATGPVVNNLGAGEYTLTLTDAAGCRAIVSQEIVYLPPPVTAALAENSFCEDGNGSITLEVSEGTLPYTYAWSHDPGLQSIQAAGLNAGTYTVVVTDNNGCTATAQATIALFVAPQISLSALTDAYCGNGNGAISVGVSGGTLPYDYTWSHDAGLNTGNANGLAAGDYSISVSDANGCVANLIATVEDDPGFQLSAAVQETTCGNANGSVSISATNGTGPFHYTWSHDQGLDAAIAADLPVAAYTVTVTDATGCQQILSATVQASDGPNLSIVTQQNATCSTNNGSVTVAVSGGDAPFTYSWSHNTALNSPSAINLAGGAYQVSVTDASGCEGIAVVSIGSAQAPVVQLLSSTETACSSPTGSIAVSVFNGTSPYTYSWSHNPALNAPTAQNLTEGTYTVSVTDATGCQVTYQASVEENTTLALNLLQTSEALCSAATGSATVQAQGGFQPYNYAWNHDPGLISGEATGLATGSYQVTVTDGAGCNAMLGISIASQNPAINLLVDQTTPSACNAPTGTISLSPAGGSAPYTYAWSHDANASGSTVSGLQAGDYSATVTDANGCTGTTATTVAPTTSPQIALAGQTDTDCAQNTGSLAVDASGGSAPYTYAWSHDASATTAQVNDLGTGIYTVSVTDANGCTSTFDATISALNAPQATVNTTASWCDQPSGSATAMVTDAGVFTYAWENAANPGVIIDTDDTADNLAEGQYVVTVTNEAGCERVVLANVEDLPDMNLLVTAEDVTCFGAADGSALAFVNAGGTAPFTYQWDNAPAGDQLNGQGPGTYTVTVTDDHGCTAESTIVINEPPVLALALTGSIQPNCSASLNGSIQVQATGGTTPYTYNWESGQTTASVTGLGAGTYEVTVTDANGCTETLQTTLQSIGDLDIAVAVTAPDCVDGSNGEATVTVTGGGSFTYQWDAPGTPSGAGITGLPAGDYHVTVSNGSGCSTAEAFSVAEAPALDLQLSATASCLNALNGSATAVASGGNSGNFTYAWSNLESGASISSLLPGFYTVTATDENGCSVSDGILVDGAPFPTLSLQNIVAPDCINITGAATVAATGGTGVVSYLWNDPSGQTGATATGLSPGSYMVTATDENGCSGTLDVTIDQPDDLVVNLSNLEAPSCNGNTDASATVTVLNGSGNYTYLWSDSQAQNTAQATDLAAGDYVVTVTDTGNNCSTTLNVTVPETPVLGLALQQAVAPLCFGAGNGSATVMATGGTAPFDYLWNDASAQTSANAINLPAGNYSVSVTDDNGCTATLSLSVPEAIEMEAEISNSTAPLCFGESTATASVSASGGTGTYTYLWDDPLLQNTQTASDLAAGNYTVVVTDGNGCQTNATVNIPSTPQLLLTTQAAVSPSCSGFSDGSITVAASGGTGSLSYLWSNDETTAQISDLSSGSYSVTVMDANGCTASQDITLTDAVALLISSSSFTLPSCFSSPDGSISITPQGGSGAYTYLWSDDDAQTTATASDLGSGAYTVTVTDGNGCFISETYTLTSNAPQIFINGNLTAPGCDGAGNGSIALSVTGGAGGFTYLWQGGETGSSVGNLVPGSYTVLVTDAQGCSEQETFEVPVGAAFAVDLGPADTSLCFGEVFFVDFSGLNYQPQWTSSNGFSSQSETVRLENAGVYMLQVSNALGCVARDTISIQVAPEPLQAHFVTPTDVVAGQEVVVVEVSWPVPDEVNWIYDPALATLVEQRGDQYIFTFPTPGQVPLTLQAITGECQDWLTKTITVHADESTIPSPGPVQELLAFRLMPNPNSGVFQVEVELSVPREIVLSVFDITGHLQDRRVRSGQAVYEEDYILSLQPGPHVVILQTPTQRKSIVFVVQLP